MVCTVYLESTEDDAVAKFNDDNQANLDRISVIIPPSLEKLVLPLST